MAPVALAVVVAARAAYTWPMTVIWGITVDCADPARQAAFWREALGYVDAPVPEGFASWEEWLAHWQVPPEEWNDGAYLVDPGGAKPSISFLKVPEPKVVKNRCHIDLKVGGRDQPQAVRGGPASPRPWNGWPRQAPRWCGKTW